MLHLQTRRLQMSFPEPALALLTLLIAPGPTNALLALAGSKHGTRASLHLILVVTLCYLVVVAPLAIWGSAVLTHLPLLRQGVTAAAALWLAALAIRLWHQPAGLAEADNTSMTRTLATTTLLNPKALIFGLVLIPQNGSPLAALALFGALIPLVSLIWLSLGASLRASHAVPLQKGAAVWLGVLAVLLFSRILA